MPRRGSTSRICGEQVTDIGCRSCGSWSHGFARGMVGLGFEVSGFWGLVRTSGEGVFGIGLPVRPLGVRAVGARSVERFCGSIPGLRWFFGAAMCYRLGCSKGPCSTEPVPARQSRITCKLCSGVFSVVSMIMAPGARVRRSASNCQR